MFTGIIETLAKVEKIEKQGSNLLFVFSCPFTHELKVDQSVSHNGVCLTVVSLNGSNYAVTAIKETLDRSNLGDLSVGDFVNLERCMPANGRFDGHIVQGHVDTTALCTSVRSLDGSWEFEFEYPAKNEHITVDKGSITVNGVSLTVVSPGTNSFKVFIIPYTFEHTNFKTLKPGSSVNLEFDIIGKYAAKLLTMRG
ncbi:MAG: riboflavin synthase [Bacteroidia bacterium]|jgi:riboflavin synthase|nr:riboflavin synthase [Bacteroidia bacterium]